MKHLLSIALLSAVALSATATDGWFTVSEPVPGYEEDYPGTVVQFADDNLPNCTWNQLPSVNERVLEQYEWDYLFEHHAYRFLKPADGFPAPGLLVLPDRYAKSTPITLDNYTSFEDALFLPAGSDGACRYWSATDTYSYQPQAYAIEFDGTVANTDYTVSKGSTLAVRTVTDMPVAPNAVRFTFDAAKSGMPIETEHMLSSSNSVKESADNTLYLVAMNGATVSYNRSDVERLSYCYFDKSYTPSLTLTARPDPENSQLYYTSFYSGLETYELPDGVVAYTASLGENNVALISSLEGNIIPQRCAVLLCATSASITLQRTEPSVYTGTNCFRGVDVPTPASTALGTYYVLSAVNSKMAFYRYGGTEIPAQKAYLFISEYSGAPARIVWQQAIPTDLELTTAPSGVEKYIQAGRLYIRREGRVYDACGVRIK